MILQFDWLCLENLGICSIYLIKEIFGERQRKSEYSIFDCKSRPWARQTNGRKGVVVGTASWSSWSPNSRHLQLEWAIGNKLRLLQCQNGIVGTDSGYSSKAILGYVAIHNTGMSLFQVHSWVPSGNPTSMSGATITISHYISSFDVGSAIWSTDVNTSCGTIMYVAVSYCNLPTINVHNSTTSRGTDRHMLNNGSRCWCNQHRLIIGATGWLNLNSGIAIPNICDMQFKTSEMNIGSVTITNWDTTYHCHGLYVWAPDFLGRPFLGECEW